jgi:transposase
VFDSTTKLFGLRGFRARVSTGPRTAAGSCTWTDDPESAQCGVCGVVSTSVKERTTTSPKDIRYGEPRIVLRWHKTRSRCTNGACDVDSFTEAIPEVPLCADRTAVARPVRGCGWGCLPLSERRLRDLAADRAVHVGGNQTVDQFV